MKLVAFQEPIFSTLQGEGILAGMPSVFVRLHGCDYQCAWCDTKDSWVEGSKSVEHNLEAVLERVRSYKPTHVVITGGNPVLQAEEVAELAMRVRMAWEDTNGFVAGAHVTLETQGSIYEPYLMPHVDLLSLSPKLHAPFADLEMAHTWIEAAGLYDRTIQLKIVVTCSDDFVRAIHFIEKAFQRHVKLRNKLHYILQPESSRGRMHIRAVQHWYEQYLRNRPGSVEYPIVRVVPQLHKTALHVI